MDGLWGDLKLTGRRLWATPLFVLFAVSSLGLGLGVTTAVYSLVHSLLWEAPPVHDAGRLMVLTTGGASPLSLISRPDFEDLRSSQNSFAALAAAMRVEATLVGEHGAEFVTAEAVTGNYFATIGVDCALGRGIQPADDQHRAGVLVLSERLWRARFGADPRVIGRAVRVGGHPFEVIGVARVAFDGLGPTAAVRTAAWIPLESVSTLDARTAFDAAERTRRRLSVVGRLSQGVTPERAAAELATIGTRIDQSDARRDAGPAGMVERRGRRTWSARPIAEREFGTLEARTGLFILAVVGLVLVVACTNLASLMLARGVGRRHDMAIRRALGASRWRLIRDSCLESAIIALLGGLVGLAVTRGLLVALTLEVPTAHGVFYLRPNLNLSALVFAGGALVLSLLVFGLEPALQLTRAAADVNSGHRASSAAMRARRHRVLLRWQVAISVSFLLVAALLGRVLAADARRDSGIALDRLALATLHFGAQGWDEARARTAVEAVLEQVRHAPGIQAAAVSSGAPFGMVLTAWADVGAGTGRRQMGQERESADLLAASPSLFETLGVEITRGRAFDARDGVSSPRVVVASEHAARAFFGTADAVGRLVSLQVWGRPPAETVTIVGIAKDTNGGPRSRTGNTLYVPFAQHYEPNLVIFARTSGAPDVAAQALRAAIRRTDPDLGVGMSGTASLLLAGPLVVARLLGAATAGLGGLTLLLAMVGLYGVLCQAVAQRTQEIGVRLSLGATAAQIEWLVFRQGFRPVIEGLAIGVALGVAGRLAVRAILVAPIDSIEPLAVAMVPIPLCVVTLLACYLPARRAASVDPNIVLRAL